MAIKCGNFTALRKLIKSTKSSNPRALSFCKKNYLFILTLIKSKLSRGNNLTPTNAIFKGLLGISVLSQPIICTTFWNRARFVRLRMHTLPASSFSPRRIEDDKLIESRILAPTKHRLLTSLKYFKQELAIKAISGPKRKDCR